MKKYIPKYVYFFLPVFIFFLVSYIVFRFSFAYAEFFNNTIGYAYRIAVAKITSFLPFSLAEFLLYLSPFLAVFIIVKLCRYSRKGKKEAVNSLTAIAVAAATVFSMYTCALAPGYGCRSLGERLNLEKDEITKEELILATEKVIEEVNKLSYEIGYDRISGASPMPFSYEEMSEKLCKAYENIEFTDSFEANAKMLIISPLMTYTHMSGMYTFFTGEININTNYPDFVVVFSTAHEMAHQRGIAREDECNFTAFLACISSDDEYIRYSGYLNMYEYLSNALYDTDEEAYGQCRKKLKLSVSEELSAYSEFFDKYRTNKAADISEKLNDAYLKSRGTEGTVSYDNVTSLAVAYLVG